MELSLKLFIVIGNLIPLIKCNPWINEYQFNSFGSNDLFDVSIPDFRFNHQSPILYDYSSGLHADVLSTHGSALLYNKIIENQIRANAIIADLEQNLPCGWKWRESCNSILQKKLYYGDFPHLKAHLLLELRRLKNNLGGLRLRSLNHNTPFRRT